MWPSTVDALERLQVELASRSAREPAWHPPVDRQIKVCGVFVATPRGVEARGFTDEPAWVAAVVLEGEVILDSAVLLRRFDAPYAPGHLALREGRLLYEAIVRLRRKPDLVMLN